MTAVAEGNSRPSTPKARPLSMGPLSPSNTGPLVTIESPKSPPKYSDGIPSIPSSMTIRASSPGTEDGKNSSRSHSPIPPPARRPFKIPSRSGTPSLESRAVPSFPAVSQTNASPDPKKFDSVGRPSTPASSPIPPPINRAMKPKPFQSPQPRKASETLAAPVTAFDLEEDKISPFSTPPSEPDSPPHRGSPPSPPDFSKPRPLPPTNFRDNYFNRPSSRTVSKEITPPPMPPRRHVEAQSDRLESRPVLPPRNKSPRPPPPPPPELPGRRSADIPMTTSSMRGILPPPRSSLDHPSSSRPKIGEARTLIPPRKSITQKEIPAVAHLPPPPPPPRLSVDSKREQSVSDRHSVDPTDSDDEEYDEDHSPERSQPFRIDFPDASQANRRPPRFSTGPFEFHAKTETKLFAVSGEIVCTTGYLTRAWNISTGEVLLNLPTHDQTVKATAIAFKPVPDGEGEKIWIGTNTGELHEIDIGTGSYTHARTNAHSRCPILKIHRHAQNMWTLDEEGKLLFWPPDESGAPNLTISPNISRVPPNPTFTLIVGTQIWIAMGQKGIWVYEPDFHERTAKQLTPQPLLQPNVGEVTSGTMVPGQPDRVYFGHMDGKVTIYSRKDFHCIDVVCVSMYKIKSLVGVGDYLWAGFSTGMIYIYDMGTEPWKVKKDWKAHEKPIADIQVDGSSLWKMSRLQVFSLSTEGLLQLWDGMLTEDWLEADLMDHETEYCDFKEVTASVMTWNAGASKPSKLRQDERDENFFREYFSSAEPPDILVFGFQELVDLEDKKVTAKSFFKSNKKKDAQEQEKMSHQYRNWRDYLARAIDENMPSSESYQLLHTSNLVGLFTCIFIKDSTRGRISSLASAQIKLGMHGLHGNKGALLVRFLIDDSSFCFLNCHLAAGQRHTTERNRDIALIMEATSLPVERDPYRLATSFAGIGGDGSMVLDHDVCVLNGDLNYRIDSIPRGGVIGAIASRNYAKLLDRDQLLVTRTKNPSFRLRAFTELPITFAPTYKFDVGTDTYDSSEKQRSPAWCDRVLFRGRGVAGERYRSWLRPKTSDHRPVTLNLKIRVRRVRNEAEVEKCREAGRRRLTAWSQGIGWGIS
jgi:endonuclease/exonuclease/phosphatase family metal-dependent hydrolase